MRLREVGSVTTLAAYNGQQETSVEVVRLDIEGAIPSKKNNRAAKGARAHYDPETRAAIDAIIWQLKAQWGNRRISVESPELRFYLKLANRKQDRDGCITTLLDCLVKAGVLFDDSVRWSNGLQSTMPAEIVDPRDQGALIVVTFPRGASDHAHTTMRKV